MRQSRRLHTHDVRQFSTIRMLCCSLLTAFFLLSTSFTVLASNPDSEIVQEASSSNQDSQKNAQLTQGNNEQVQDASSGPISNEELPFVYNQAISPIRTGTFVTKEVIRQVLPFGYVSVERRNRVVINSRSNSGLLSSDRLSANTMYGNRINPNNFPQYGTRRVSYGIRHQNRIPYGQPPQQPHMSLDPSVNNQRSNTMSSNPSVNNQRPNTMRFDPSVNNQRPNTMRFDPSVNNQRPNTMRFDPSVNNQRPNTISPNPSENNQRPNTLNSNPSVNNQRSSSMNSNPSVNNQRPNNNAGNENSAQVPQRIPENRVSSGTLNVNPNGDGRPARRPSYRPFLTYNPQSGRHGASNYGGYNPPRNNPYNRAGAQNPPSPSGQNVNRRISPDLNLYSGIVNDFAFKLVDAMNIESNFVISPLSVFIALSMCYMGSNGSTKTQLEKILGLDKYSVHEVRLHQGIRDLILAVIPQSNQEYQLFIANAMFLGKDFLVNHDFESNIQRLYSAELKNLDFGNPQLSVPFINDWVSRATRNMITKISDEPPSPATSLLLLNAIYFQGIWKKQFPTNMTYVGRFFTPDGQDKMVPTMPLYGESFPMYRSDSHKHTFIKLPYQGDQISMIIALPFTFRDQPMPSNTDQILCHVRDAMKETVFDAVTVPKFKMEFTTSLKNPLMRMGIADLFNPNAVNLNKIRSANDVVVSNMVHKAVVEVNERGTTASASTAVKFVPLAYRNTTDFIVNHPFAYYIIHEPSGLVLFYGKVYDIGVDPASNDRPIV